MLEYFTPTIEHEHRLNGWTTVFINRLLGKILRSTLQQMSMSRRAMSRTHHNNPTHRALSFIPSKLSLVGL